MKQETIPYQAADWAALTRTEYKGESGTSFWRTLQLPGLRIRIVEYSPGYLADHWCSRGHVLYVLSGALVTELKDGRSFTLLPGQSYQVADDEEPHRSRTAGGATLFIVD